MKDTWDVIAPIKVRVVKDPTYTPTLHLTFKAGVPTDPELWVNASVAHNPHLLRRYLEWAQAQWNSNSQRAQGDDL